MVKINGGSQLVDLQEIDLSTETGQTKTGLYADLANAYKDNKLMIGFNALNDGKVVSPLPMIVFAASDTEIHCLFLHRLIKTVFVFFSCFCFLLFFLR